MAVDIEPVAHQDRDIAQVMVHPAFWQGISRPSDVPYLYRTLPPEAWPIFSHIDQYRSTYVLHLVENFGIELENEYVTYHICAGNLTNDVALLFTNTDEPFVLGEYLDTICLPSTSEQRC